MFTRILVPLDGSELAERALSCAERLAAATGAAIHLVRVVVSPPIAPWMMGTVPVAPTVVEDIETAETETAQTYLEAMRARLASTGLAVQTVTLLGDPAVALLDYERSSGIDLVVMCSHGRSGLARFTLGSVADRLLRHGTAPLLIVRAFGPPVDLTRALVPLDGSAAAEEALGLLPALRASGPGRRPLVQELTLLRVAHGQEEGVAAERYLAEVVQRLQQEGICRGGEGVCRSRVAQGDPAQAILAAAGTDTLVLMATHGRSGVLRWALGSVADRVVRGGAAGVLLIRTGHGSGND